VESVTRARPAPDFYLWHPREEHGSAGLSVEVDAVPASGRHLCTGDAELCLGFAAALGWTMLAVEEWQVSRFCSPYYSSYPDDPNWAARFQVAWRLRFRGPAGPAVSPGPGPFPVSGTDPTWRPAGEFWLPGGGSGREDCDILGDQVVGPGGGPDLDLDGLSRAAGVSLTVHRSELAGGGVLRHIQARLPAAAFPADVARLEEIAGVFAQAGLVTRAARTQLQVAGMLEATQVPGTRRRQ
jgi:hypothetical protein